MKRREFVEKAGIGAAAIALGSAGHARASTRSRTQHGHGAIRGPLATATVSFGAWAAGTDRFPNIGAVPGLPINIHALIPNEVTIKAGGTVNFIVAGFHLVEVYGNGTRPEDIDINVTVPVTVPPGPPLIDDPRNRVYRGIDPTVLPLLQGPPQGPAQPQLQDRVEVVHFPDPGDYLVICGVLPHFAVDGMFGFVKVNP